MTRSRNYGHNERSGSGYAAVTFGKPEQPDTDQDSGKHFLSYDPDGIWNPDGTPANGQVPAQVFPPAAPESRVRQRRSLVKGLSKVFGGQRPTPSLQKEATTMTNQLPLFDNPSAVATESPPTTAPRQQDARVTQRHSSEDTEKSSAPQQKKQRYAPPELLPHQGLHFVLWLLVGRWLYPFTGWSWLVRRSNRERFNTACKTVWDLRHVQKIYAVVNSKGGSVKTSMTVYLGKLHMSIVKMNMVALDANVNVGHTAKRLGIIREATLQLRTFISAVATDLRSWPALLDMIEWEPETGLGVIASEKASNAYFSRKSFMTALSWLKDKVHSVWCDLGNGIMTPSNVGSVMLAETLIFPALATSGDSLDDVQSTQDRYTEMKLGDKVRNGVIIIVGVRRFLPSVMKPRTAEEKAKIEAGEEVEDHFNFHLTQAGARRAFAAFYDWPIERLFVVPKNHYMKRDKPAKLGRIPLRVRVVLAEALVAVIKAKVVPTAAETPQLAQLLDSIESADHDVDLTVSAGYPTEATVSNPPQPSPRPESAYTPCNPLEGSAS